MNRKAWIEAVVQATSYEIRDLIPGSDYCISIQSVLGSDTSQAVHREFSTSKKHTGPEKDLEDSFVVAYLINNGSYFFSNLKCHVFCA